MHATQDFGGSRKAGALDHSFRNCPQHSTSRNPLRQQMGPAAFTHDGRRLMADQVPDMALGCKLRDFTCSTTAETHREKLRGGEIGFCARKFGGKRAFLPEELLGEP